MPIKPAEKWIKKQITRAAGATEDFKDGVRNCAVDPPALALKANAKRIANLQASIAKKTWETKMAKISKADWQAPTLEKSDRFASGVAAAEPKIRKFVTAFRPKLEAIQSAVNAMPDVTEAQREARVIENLRRMRAAKGTW